MLLPLIRPLGLFLTIPTLVYLFQQRRRQQEITPDQLALLLAPIIGFGIYLLWMQASTGDFLTGFKVQRFYISHRSVAAMFMPWKLVMAFFSEGLLLHHFTLSIIDRLMFVFFVFAAAVSYRRLPLFVWVFAVTMGLMPALSGSFMSYSRYALMIFPLFWGLELWAGSSSGKRGIILFFLSSALFLQGFLILRHVNALWAA